MAILFIGVLTSLFKPFKWLNYLFHLALLFLGIDATLSVLGVNDFASLVTLSYEFYETLLLSILILLSFVLLLFKQKSLEIKVKPWLRIILLVVGLSASFFRPLYIDNWYSTEGFKTENFELMERFKIEKELQLTADKQLFAFFTTTCPHCNEAALKMGIQRDNGNLPETVIVFPSKKEDAERFLKRNGLEGQEYLLVSDRVFLEFAGNRFPSIYYKNENNYYHWVGGSFNYLALDLLKN